MRAVWRVFSMLRARGSVLTVVSCWGISRFVSPPLLHGVSCGGGGAVGWEGRLCGVVRAFCIFIIYFRFVCFCLCYLPRYLRGIFLSAKCTQIMMYNVLIFRKLCNILVFVHLYNLCLYVSSLLSIGL